MVRIFGVLLTVALLVAYGFAHRANKLGKKLAAAETALVNAGAIIRAHEKAAVTSQRLQTDYENELATLRNRPTAGVPVVRLCPVAPAATASLPGHPAPASGSVTAPAGAGDDGRPDAGHPQPGPDIGPALVTLARDMDEIVARCRLGQAWGDAVEKSFDIAGARP